MCMRSFVTVRCVLTKRQAFFENGNNKNNRRCGQGRFRVQKYAKLRCEKLYDTMKYENATYRSFAFAQSEFSGNANMANCE